MVDSVHPAGLFSGYVQPFDDRIRLFVHQHASPAFTAAMRGFSMIGTPVCLIALGAAVVVWSVRAGRTRAAVRFAIAVAGAEVLDQLLKMLFHRPRPATFFGLAEPAGYSFPSGHALVSCAFFGGLAMLAAERTASLPRRWLYYVAAAVPIAAIGFSRVYLGMHYPSDVLGGYAAGVAWLSIVWRVRR